MLHHHSLFIIIVNCASTPPSPYRVTKINFASSLAPPPYGDRTINFSTTTNMFHVLLHLPLCFPYPITFSHNIFCPLSECVRILTQKKYISNPMVDFKNNSKNITNVLTRNTIPKIYPYTSIFHLCWWLCLHIRIVFSIPWFVLLELDTGVSRENSQGVALFFRISSTRTEKNPNRRNRFS